MDPTKNSIVQEYILPDLSRNQKGRVHGPDDIRLDTDQVLVMNNERFVVPETLFRPDDIGKGQLRLAHWLAASMIILGLEQMGLAPTVAHVISLLPEDLRGLFWANIGLVGGNTKLRGFRSRLYAPFPLLRGFD